MNFEFILLIILFSFLRKKLQTKILLPEWDKKFQIGLFASITLLVISVTIRSVHSFMPWVAYAMFFYLIYFLLTRKEFVPVKSVVYALLPLALVKLIANVIKLISKDFFTTWKNYFETAALFSVLWLIAMLILNNKQHKALEKEKLKAAEREKEFQASESMKAMLEVQVAERTAALTKQKEELQQAMLELKATQTQLIHSEKMASLGELTAGIAHEIQNPLNFVNNFSEVSSELIDEMNEELEKGNTEDVKQIASDLKQNLQKINHHGKRAGDIVKGMLQHSRTGSGKKEPTDINALADEYLRLAYHGLRAKDKSFNARYETDFDSTLPKINVVPQDIGRVILNLITNAFYVVNEKRSTANEQYEPTVTVSTKKIDDKVLISVKDNGNGIPESIKEKIFQPFFTTKPTGQGTGLGLSLSYDIVKAHGGELKVEAKDGEGSVFSIVLPVV